MLVDPGCEGVVKQIAKAIKGKIKLRESIVVLVWAGVLYMPFESVMITTAGIIH